MVDLMTPAHRAGTGEPLVLLHGATMSWRAWRPVLAELQAEHDVFAPTLAGHRGAAPWRAGERAQVAGLVDAVCAQLDEARIGSAHVVGNSLGGWVALELARRGRATTCTVLSPAGSWRHARDARRLQMVFRVGLALGRSSWVRRLAVAPLVRGWAFSRVMEHGERLSRDDALGLFADLDGCAAISSLLTPGHVPEAVPPFAGLPCPVRVAWAERDRVIPYHRYGAPLRRVLPGAEFVRLPGCGHVPMWDDPDLVVRTILDVTSVSSPRDAPRTA